MTIALYLCAVDRDNKPLTSPTGVTVRNPFRAPAGTSALGVNVLNPILVSSYALGADLGLSTGGGTGTTAGKVAISDLSLTLPEDRNALPLFLYACKGLRLNTADLLLVKVTDTPAAVLKPFAGFGLSNAFVDAVSWSGSADSADSKLDLNGAVVSVGWADDRADGTPNTFSIASWDIVRNVQA